MIDSLGIYVSVPFCKAKCSFCNFASGVFAAERIEVYVARLLEEIHEARTWAAMRQVQMSERVDTVYFGGGTPSLLEPSVIARIFKGIRDEFVLEANAEMTVECAPGQITDLTLAAFQAEGVNRLSFGVQSFVDRECAAVGRLHSGAECRQELRRMQAAGIERLGIDLIVGLPHQTEASWRYSVEQAVECGVEHVSVYMLEVDDDSRLGREALGGGQRYGAGELPHEDRVADWYEAACEWLETAGLRQYEISNFAREGGQSSGQSDGQSSGQSRHNRKYWERQPYVGFGLDAHSMLRAGLGGVRWANAEEMGSYVGHGLGSQGFSRTVDRIGTEAAFEEALFLGLRLVDGVDLASLDSDFGLCAMIEESVEEVVSAGLLERVGNRLKLTAKGRMASNEVFERLLIATPA